MRESFDATPLRPQFTRIANEWFQHQFLEISPNVESFTSFMTEAEIKDKWLVPLIELLYLYITTDDYYAKTVYFGERVNRPFTHVSCLLDKKNYFSRVIPQDLKAFVTELPDLNATQLTRLRQLHDFLLDMPDTTRVNLVTLGDCLMSQLNAPLTYALHDYRIGIQSQENYIGAWGSETDNFQLPDHAINTTSAPITIIAISFFTYWGLPTYRNLMKLLWEKKISDSEAEPLLNSIIHYIRQHLLKLSTKTNSIIFLHNAGGLPWLQQESLYFFPWFAQGEGDHNRLQDYIGRINNAIDGIIEENNALFLIDERDILARVGITECTREVITNSQDGTLFHYNIFSYYLAEKYILHLTDILLVHQKKLVFVDFDNTLWDGVMADGFVTHHREKQQLISSLAQAGIILVALSKNDINNIRWSEMRILKNDFSSLKINWLSKVTNILRALKELNISADHCVLIDDSVEEIGLVQSHLPQITCLNATRDDSWSTIRTLLKLNSNTTQDARKRKDYYHDQEKRREFLETSEKSDKEDLDSLLKPLQITVNIREATENDLDRVMELLSRTNQFNCSGTQYKKHELEAFLESPLMSLYIFDIKDRFGDMGTVGAVILRRDKLTSTCVIDNFVMSCRAMGYGVEQFALSHIIKATQADTYIGIVCPTTKNAPALGFYPTFGFRLDEKTKQWTFHRSQYVLPDPSWINRVSA